ncbi:Mu transposase C-terminal domain-containing protein [Clostridium sp. C2-6-12]|uniref:Mu transposase C-terminal domain-containing protein n=1 Tax=Clostridium sp. C2-6-12 TaxID=2698832 RepID=UPI001367EDC0|nr:Mu transposase C-terminal domain-containing protein [Clostridium sp. C2-6-12]
MGKRYVVVSIEPPNVFIRRIDSDGVSIMIEFSELVSNALINDENSPQYIKPIADANEEISFNLLSGHKKDIAYKKMDVIRPLIIFKAIKEGYIRANYEFKEYYSELTDENEELTELNQEELINRIAKKENISVRTIKRYLSAYRKAENVKEKSGVEGLVPKSGSGYLARKDNKTLNIYNPRNPNIILDSINVRIDSVYIPIIQDVISKEYLTTRQAGKNEIYDSICVKCFMKNIPPPKMITIYKLLDRVNPQVKSRLRNSKEAAAIYDDIERGFSNEDAMYPLHVIEIDHTELDMDVMDSKTGYVTGRPWITLGIDVYSRCIWCMYISFEPPSANRVRKALENGIFFKDNKYDTQNKWDVFGIPNTIFLDNGPDFKSVEVKRMINDTLKSHVKYRPVRTPRYGGVIERCFGTINEEFIHRLEGTRKSNFRKLGEYEPEKMAALTLDDIKELLTIYITDVYHCSEHKGLPVYENIPLVRYSEGIKKAGYPEFISKSDEEFYKVELMATDMKPYTRDGVRLGNVIYKSPEFSQFIGGRDKKYRIKYNDDDISKIYILNPKLNQYIELRAAIPSYESLVNVNRYTYKKMLELIKEEGIAKRNEIISTDGVIKAKAKLKQIISKKYDVNRSIRKQAQRTNFDMKIDFSDAQINTKENNMKLEDIISQAKKIEERRNKK